ncbi:hypothetical protein BDZ90DRAFT_234811 [Jaminaea rosea]|uniref:Uncharacterized protein n=1 Tax=Jaminaea rosea TaxID=1569628 RepID=A0A316UI18_9BASI|nr:hypothetical protein BDZ90DRAFT_234811 [Jaminaea rosea]PWN24528.1 hypothetical protein BDZ90DRAFT_234811 [Jaminaea rosea]
MTTAAQSEVSSLLPQVESLETSMKHSVQALPPPAVTVQPSDSESGEKSNQLSSAAIDSDKDHHIASLVKMVDRLKGQVMGFSCRVQVLERMIVDLKREGMGMKDRLNAVEQLDARMGEVERIVQDLSRGQATRDVQQLEEQRRTIEQNGSRNGQGSSPPSSTRCPSTITHLPKEAAAGLTAFYSRLEETRRKDAEEQSAARSERSSDSSSDTIVVRDAGRRNGREVGCAGAGE